MCQKIILEKPSSPFLNRYCNVTLVSLRPYNCNTLSGGYKTSNLSVLIFWQILFTKILDFWNNIDSQSTGKHNSWYNRERNVYTEFFRLYWFSAAKQVNSCWTLITLLFMESFFRVFSQAQIMYIIYPKNNWQTRNYDHGNNGTKGIILHPTGKQ